MFLPTNVVGSMLVLVVLFNKWTMFAGLILCVYGALKLPGGSCYAS